MHTNPEVLALLALGEDVGDAAERNHVHDCPDCAREVRELAQLTGVGRSLDVGDTLTRPAPHVWERVQAELGFRDAADSDLPGPAVSDPRQDRTAATVTALTPRTGRPAPSPRWMALAAAVALIAGLGIGAGWQQFREPDQTVIADAQLEAFPKYPGSTGKAVIETDSDGNRELVVTVETPGQVQDLQVWLIEANGKGLRAMGFVNKGRGHWPVPAGMDLSKFPIVDVSDEPLNDLNPAHSGNTVVRGTLDS